MLVIGLTPKRALKDGVTDLSSNAELIRYIETTPWFLGEQSKKETTLVIAIGNLNEVVKSIRSFRIHVYSDENKYKITIDETINFEAVVFISRNPVGYLYVDADTKFCACGCGTDIGPNRDFLQGHDQKALYNRIKMYFGGSTLEAIKELDRIFGPKP